MPSLDIRRGEIWWVRFDPSEGDEIRKTRPAVVMTALSAGRIGLQIVVPITGWQPAFEEFALFVSLTPSPRNGLTKQSAANAFQVKSVAVSRFQSRIGVLSTDEIDAVASAVALCVGYRP